MQPDEDPYSQGQDQTAADMVRALAVYPDGSVEAGEALRSATSWLVEAYGTAGVLDLAEILAADLVEALSAIGRIESRSTLEVIGSWTHDEPVPGEGH